MKKRWILLCQSFIDCVSYFCITVTKISDRNNLTEERLILDHNFNGLQNIMVMRPHLYANTWWQTEQASIRNGVGILRDLLWSASTNLLQVSRLFKTTS